VLPLIFVLIPFEKNKTLSVARVGGNFRCHNGLTSKDKGRCARNTPAPLIIDPPEIPHQGQFDEIYLALYRSQKDVLFADLADAIAEPQQ